MAIQIIRLTNNNESWNQKKRYRVNDVVNDSGGVYQNFTGGNSNPTLLIDWINISFSSPLNPVYVTADGIQNTFPLGSNSLVKQVFIESVLSLPEDWSQTGSDLVLTYAPTAGSRLQIF